jgi:hypothetical protein
MNRISCFRLSSVLRPSRYLSVSLHLPKNDQESTNLSKAGSAEITNKIEEIQPIETWDTDRHLVLLLSFAIWLFWVKIISKYSKMEDNKYVDSFITQFHLIGKITVNFLYLYQKLRRFSRRFSYMI